MKTLRFVVLILILNCITLFADNQNPTKDEVAKLYVATFNRAPDNAGLLYWINNSGLTLEQIAQSFFDQEETLTLYPNGTTNRAFIQAVYNNLFNRNPDSGGWDYWETQLNLGRISRNMFIIAVINGAKDDANGFDATTLENKKEVGVYFANNNLNNYYQAIYAMQGVTSDYTTVSFIKSKIDSNELTSTVWNNFGNLSNESVDLLARNAAVIIPGCSYTSENSIVFLNTNDVLTYKTIIRNLVDKKDESKTTKRSTAINQTLTGTCGGTATITGSENNGDSNLTFALNNYCTNNGNDQTVLNGSMNIFVDTNIIDGVSTIKGLTASTQGNGIVIATTVDNQTVTETVKLTNFSATIGEQNSITADNISIVSSENGTYQIINLNIITYTENNINYLQVVSSTYIDPDVGSVNLTTTPIAITGNGTGSATITVSNGDNSAVFTSNDASTGYFNLVQNGKTIGALDCYSLRLE